eukprot:6713715-Pyramimonas_sp.AAC.1
MDMIYKHACYMLKGVADLLGSVDLAPAKRKMNVTCAYPSVAKRVCRTLGRSGYRHLSALE